MCIFVSFLYCPLQIKLYLQRHKEKIYINKILIVNKDTIL